MVFHISGAIALQMIQEQLQPQNGMAGAACSGICNGKAELQYWKAARLLVVQDIYHCVKAVLVCGSIASVPSPYLLMAILLCWASFSHM